MIIVGKGLQEIDVGLKIKNINFVVIHAKDFLKINKLNSIAHFVRKEYIYQDID